MTDVLTSVVSPYSQFLECQERRRRVRVELMLQDRSRTIDADVMPAGRHGIVLPGVRMVGSNADDDAHLEAGPRGFVPFLLLDADVPVLDVNGTPEALDVSVRAPQAALASRCASNGNTDQAVQMPPHRAAPRAEPPTTR
jgi:hypothetical protein